MVYISFEQILILYPFFSFFFKFCFAVLNDDDEDEGDEDEDSRFNNDYEFIQPPKQERQAYWVVLSCHRVLLPTLHPGWCYLKMR